MPHETRSYVLFVVVSYEHGALEYMAQGATCFTDYRLTSPALAGKYQAVSSKVAFITASKIISVYLWNKPHFP